MKKIALISSLLVLTISQFGYHAFYAYKIYYAKQLAKERLLMQIPDQFLTKINVSDNSLFFLEENGKELQINGTMYDVVKMGVLNGKKYLFCVEDKYEDLLIKDLSNLNKDGNDANNANKNYLSIKFQLIDIICADCTALAYGYYSFAGSHKSYFDYKSKLSFRYKNINTPPPQI